MRILRPLWLLLPPLSLGCFQVESTVTLAEDLSGTVGFTVTANLEQLAVVMATLPKSFMGDNSPPTETELKEARAELMEQLQGEDFHPDNLKRDIGQDLPDGVELLGVEQGFEGLEFRMKMAFGFAHASLLTDIIVEPGGQDAPGDNRPFSGLTFVEENGTLVIRNTPAQPITESTAALNTMMDDELIRSMFEEMRISFSLLAPFEVLEHNATERVGNRLSWVYTYDTFGSTSGDSVYVRYRR